ncbi:MAG: ORF6N domain-containing protein [Candidatus Bipolaricaulis sp.]|nr:ORF6N domain-containing protein [Candidatus Bipolaricaulis sp.]
MYLKDGEMVDAARRNILTVGHVEERIISLRGQNVILDADFAELYGVETKRLNEQVRRNAKRFPLDFVFQLSSDEYDLLRSHSATSSWGDRRYPPYAFTEHGALMAANVLASERAVEMSVLIVRAFMALRRALAGHEELARKLDELEARYDVQFRAVFDAIRQLMTPPNAAERS